MKRGWVSLYRSLASEDIWLEEPFTRGQAWADLILLANHTDGRIRVAGQVITIKRGQCGWSEMRLAERWKWSRGKVRRFMSELNERGWTSTDTNNRTTITTICNYNQYQAASDSNDTPDGTTDGHQTVQQTDTNNNNIIINNKRITPSKPRVTLDELSISHIQDWLDMKRVGGKYLLIDENRLLEKFKDYCRSRGRVYKDYVAALRNAFEWDDAPRKGNHDRKLTSEDARDEVLAEYGIKS